MIVLEIPAPCQAISANQRIHWAKRARWTKAWRARAYVAAIQAGRPKLDRAHVTVTIHFTDKRRRDVANLYPTVKAVVDGIVGDASVLPDDSDAYLVGPDMRPGDKRDVLTLVVTLDPDCGCAACAERWAA